MNAYVNTFINFRKNAFLKKVILIFLGTLFISLASKIQIPFYPVPFTMQSFSVLLIGVLYGRKLGLLTVLLYLSQGFSGLPVFAMGGGISYLFMPTSGYLIGFIFSVYIAGYAADKKYDRNFLTSCLFLGLAHCLIFASGVLGLSFFYNVKHAFAVGVVPFIIPAILKFMFVSLIFKFLWVNSKSNKGL